MSICKCGYYAADEVHFCPPTRGEELPTQKSVFIPPAPAKAAPDETTHFQVIYTLQDLAGNQLFRGGVPTIDKEAADKVASGLLERHDVKEVFITTVHKAFVKETTVKQVI